MGTALNIILGQSPDAGTEPKKPEHLAHGVHWFHYNVNLNCFNTLENTKIDTVRVVLTALISGRMKPTGTLTEIPGRDIMTQKVPAPT